MNLKALGNAAAKRYRLPGSRIIRHLRPIERTPHQHGEGFRIGQSAFLLHVVLVDDKVEASIWSFEGARSRSWWRWAGRRTTSRR
jgi:hypothetical protein